MSQILDSVTVNKIKKSDYDAAVEAGTISPQMIREETWIFTDDQFVSASDKTKWDNKANISDIPTKTSDLTNDSGYITSDSIPTKTSQLTNDSGFITSNDVPTKTSELTNDSGFITESDIPKDLSDFNNDVGYITHETDPTVPAWAKEPTKPTYTKADVGLGNVDNKSSATIRSEITSSNVITALGYTPVDSNLIGVNNGVAGLDSNGKVPSSQLPSYVDDIVEGYYNTTDGKFYKESTYTTEIPGEADKIYVSLDTNKTYRWGGTEFVVIASDLALGETHSTAYYGDLGKIAYDHSQSAHAPVNAEANIIDSISVNNTALTPDANKNVNISVPTKTSDLTNDSGFVTSADIPTELSELNNDVGYITSYTETDPIFSASPAATITSNNIADWSNKADTSDIKNGTLNIKRNNISLGTFSANQSTDQDINIEVPVNTSDLTNDEHFITSSNNSIKNIIEITYADYQQLVADDDVDPDTEYHIIDNQSSLGDMETFINYLILEADKRKHPIGSLEFNVSGTNPSTYLGFGTWELWGSGRVPVGVDTTQTEFNTVEKTGGSKTSSTTYTPAGTNTGGSVGSHTLTAAESGLPEHTHKLPLGPTVGVNGMDDVPARAKGSSGSDANFRSGRTTGTSSNPNDYGASLLNGKNASAGHTHPFTNPTFTGTQATITESTVQPYITCYMWKRTA